MELKNLAPILNNKIMKNFFGEETTIAEDLSNWNDFGTKIADMTASQFKDFMGTFVAGVLKADFDLRTWKPTGLGLIRDNAVFDGLVQMVKNKTLIEAIDSPVGQLASGSSYIDGTYHGTSVDTRVYTRETSFRIPYSLPDDAHIRKSFVTAEGVLGFANMIVARVENSRTSKLWSLEKRLLNSLIVNAYKDSRKIDLVTLYNTTFDGVDVVTTANCLYNAQFIKFMNETINRLQSLVQDYNKKYNNGDVEMFTRPEDIKTVMLNEALVKSTYNLYADTYHNDMVTIGDVTTVNYWQNSTKDLLPTLGKSAEIKETDGATEDETITTVSNVVGIIFDINACGITTYPLPLATEIVGAGRFVNYYHDELAKYIVDPRNNAIVLTLN